MSNQSTKQQETPNLFPAGRLAATGNGDKYNEPLAVAEVGARTFALNSSFAGAGKSLRNNTYQPTPLLSPPLSSNSPLPTDILPARTQTSTHHVVPLLTPDSSPTNTPSYIQSACPHVSLPALLSFQNNTQKASNSFLKSLFPKHALEASKVSQSVLITSNASSISWSGALLDAHQVPGSPTLLVGVPVAEGVEIREHVEILLDLASDSLNCSTLVFVLDKSSPDLRELVHGLLFIGGTIVRPDARNGWEWEVDKGKVLIGMEL